MKLQASLQPWEKATLPHLSDAYLKIWFPAHCPVGQFLSSMWSCQPGTGQNEPTWVMAFSSTSPPCHKMAAETTQQDFMLCSPFSMTRKGQLILREDGVRECQQMAISKPWSSMKTWVMMFYKMEAPCHKMVGETTTDTAKADGRTAATALCCSLGKGLGIISGVVFLPSSCTPSFRDVLCGLAVPCAVIQQGRAAFLPAGGGQAKLGGAASCPKVQPSPGLLGQHRSLQTRQTSAATVLPSSLPPQV